jgi:type IV pilus assembly protein PilC
MPKFVYRGVSPGGKETKGEIEAKTKRDAVGLLSKERMRILSIRAKKIRLALPFGPEVTSKDLARFTRQLAIMTSAGVPLVECLDMLASHSEDPRFAGKIRGISAKIVAGSAFSSALAEHPEIFNRPYCTLVACGEVSGNLDGVLLRLADYQEKSGALRRKIRTALAYPCILAIAGPFIMAVMLLFVVPNFARKFEAMGGAMPLPTRIVLSASHFLRGNIFFVLAGAAVCLAGLAWYWRSGPGRRVIDSVKLKLPIFGDLERKSAVSRFSQTLAALLSNGVKLPQALSISAGTSGNTVIEKSLLKALEEIAAGQALDGPLKKTGVFPPVVIQMISAGEKTDNLSGTLARISEFYREEIDAAVDALTSVVEPVMIALMGALVGGVLIAMYLPVFHIMGPGR